MNFSSNKLYSAEAVRDLDRIAIQEYKIPGYDLMSRAGKVVFEIIQNEYPLAKKILVCCGAGNNAGDGYVIARLAMRAGLDVSVLSLVDVDKLQGDALTAYNDWHSLGHQLVNYSNDLIQQFDVITDALLGTGLDRDIEGEWAELIDAINAQHKPVVSVDIPSGLSADTGCILGTAVRASITVSFIGLKKGLFTHSGVDCCGDIRLDDLSLPEAVYSRQPAQAELLNGYHLRQSIKKRSPATYKHQCGHVLILGGDKGMPGAVRLTAEAALRAGAGLVSVVSHAEHVAVLLAGLPEVMLAASVDGLVDNDLLNRADVVIVGPGLTMSQWSRNLFSAALGSSAPKVVDAGALRLLSAEALHRNDWVLTPHAGEAAALLQTSSADIQASRFTSVELLQHKYGGQVVLKGAGSLLQSPSELTQVCPYGNPGMATAGMGDVLSGVIGSLLAQGYNSTLAARLGICIHSMAGDLAAQDGQTGLISSDLFPSIRQLMNPADSSQH